jgi:hypothetical protein
MARKSVGRFVHYDVPMSQAYLFRTPPVPVASVPALQAFTQFFPWITPR